MFSEESRSSLLSLRMSFAPCVIVCISRKWIPRHGQSQQQNKGRAREGSVDLLHGGKSLHLSALPFSCPKIIRILSLSTLGRVGNKLKPVLPGYILTSPRVVTNICQYQQICLVVHLPYLCCHRNLQLIVRDGVMLGSPYRKLGSITLSNTPETPSLLSMRVWCEVAVCCLGERVLCPEPDHACTLIMDLRLP